MIGVCVLWFYAPHTVDGVVGKDHPLLLASNFSKRRISKASRGRKGREKRGQIAWCEQVPVAAPLTLERRPFERRLGYAHGNLGPHIHFESLNPLGRVIENNHVRLLPDAPVVPEGP